MDAKILRIGDFSISHSKISHFCTESTGRTKRWLRDDFNFKHVEPQHISVFSKIDADDLTGFPFRQTDRQAKQNHNEYIMMIYEKLYKMEKITLSSSHLHSDMIHYVISPHKNKVHTIGLEQEEIRKKLSKRETEVLIHLANGRSMSSIAKQLFLSPHTIDSHRLNLCKKLKVRRTTELAVWAYKLGLLEQDLIKSKIC